MGSGGVFRELGGFLDECERRGTAVNGLGVTDRDGAETGEELTADVELTLSTALSDGGGDAMGTCTPRIGSDGTLELAFESTEAVVPAGDYDVRIEPTDATVNADGTVTVALSAAVPSADGSEPARDTADRPSSGGMSGTPAGSTHDTDTDGDGEGDGDSDVPPFRDPDLLADVYESCDTFAEMADSLGMDVTAETVRRYMIDYDIHEPDSYRTGSGGTDATDGAGEPSAEGDPDAGQPVVLSDGIGLPDDVTVDTLIETVERSNTIYEVKQEIGIDRQDALDMLQELNLLDLVVGRLATEGERDITREDVVDRLREASATQSADR